ncbi:MAG TPA: hypothetical protein DCO69_02205 [Clostridiales bacterium]|nr:hypothetical protein [Clostridiales bacterium]
MEKLQKILIGAMAFFFLLGAAALVLLLRPERSVAAAETQARQTLTQSIRRYPDNLRLGQVLTEHTFTTPDGQTTTLSAHLGAEWTLCMYWGSWCGYCEKQVELLAPLTQKLENLGVKVLLIDKMDPQKESLEAAKTAISEKGILFDWIIDENLTVYEALGMHIIPTTFFLDSTGRVRLCRAGTIGSEAELEALLDYAKNGGASGTEEFVRENLLNAEGGVSMHVYESSAQSPSGRDVLAESQGLLMEYAAETHDRTLFEEAYGYAKTNLDRQGLLAWYASNGGTGNVNALLDDLRVLKSLNAMGGYTEDVMSRAIAIAAGNRDEKGNLVDFYSFADGGRASRLTMCYCDWQALEIIRPLVPGFGDSLEAAEEILEGAYLGGDFPFYANYYDYETKTYDDSSLNMAEAMLTLLHQAQAGQLKDASLGWLQAQMAGDGIYARYDIHGNVVSGGDYESAAIYAIVGLIAQEVGDDLLLTQAVSRMEAFRCFAAGDPLNGAFADSLEDVNAFDQCLALILYAGMDSQET